MNFLQVWAASYFTPKRAVDQLKDKPAPHWGLYGVLIRCILVSLAWYLPAFVLGREPPKLNYLTFTTTENFYLLLSIIFPALTLFSWLLDAAIAHVILRMIGWDSNIDQILNIDGMGYLVLAPLVLIWDWFTLAIGWDSATVLWGIVHLLITLVYTVFVLIGFRRILHLPYWLGIIIVIIWFAYSIPLSILFLGP